MSQPEQVVRPAPSPPLRSSPLAQVVGWLEMLAAGGSDTSGVSVDLPRAGGRGGVRVQLHGRADLLMAALAHFGLSGTTPWVLRCQASDGSGTICTVEFGGRVPGETSVHLLAREGAALPPEVAGMTGWDVPDGNGQIVYGGGDLVLADDVYGPVAPAGQLVPLASTTLAGGRYGQAYEVHDVVAEVTLLASAFPKVLAGAKGWLGDEHAAGRIGHDGARPAAAEDPTAAADRELGAAIRIAHTLTAVLDAARDSTSHLASVPGCHGP
jgi:hypothetical protein